MKVAQCRTAIFAIMSGGRCPPMDLMASTTASQQDRLRKLVQPWPRHKRFSTGRRLARKTCQCEGPWSGLALRLRRRCSNSHDSVSYTHLRAHETDSYLVCRLLLEKKKKTI